MSVIRERYFKQATQSYEESSGASPFHLPKILEAVIQERNPESQIYNYLDYSARGSTEVSFDDLRKYYNWVPQINSAVDNLHEMVVGSEIAINADDEEAKKVIDDFCMNTDLYGKMRTILKTMLVCGVSLVEKVGNGKSVENIEEIDILSVYDKIRDKFGNIVKYELQTTDGKDEINPKKVIEFGFNQFSREKWARSIFHSLAVTRTIGNRKSRPMAENIILEEDAMVAIQQNLGFPERWYVFEGADKDTIEKEGRKLKERKPGDVRIASRKPEVVDLNTPELGRTDGIVNHLDKVMTLGGGFPTELMSADFTSRASSEVTLDVTKQKVKAIQKYAANKLKKELFEIILYSHESGKWSTPEKIAKANLSASFETNNPITLTVDDVKQRVQAGIWTLQEARNWDKQNTGVDLPDDDIIQKQQSDKLAQMNQQVDPRKKDGTKTDEASDKQRDEKLSESVKCQLCKEHQHSLCTKKSCKCAHI